MVRALAHVTVVEVAERAGVSKSTVSLVLKNSQKVHPETAARVRQAILELNYVPNRSARALQSGCSRLLGVILSDITNPYFSELVRSITTVAGQSNYDVMIFDTDYSSSMVHLHLEHLRQYRCDGVFILTTERDSTVIDALNRAGLPAVLLNWGQTGKRVSDLTVDYQSGMDTLLDHLVGLGHRRLAFVSGPNQYHSAVAKVDAFRHACTALSGQVEEPYYLAGDVRLGRETGESVTTQLLSMDPAQRPTAVIASNDLMAISLLRALQMQGFRVPQDLSVASIDDIHIADYLTPPLTTLRQPRRQMAAIAFEMLQSLINSEQQVSRQHSVELRLIVRGSTGISPDGATPLTDAITINSQGERHVSTPQSTL
jgi:DNA-binding LacI/PurR family transcriptional regulator